MRARDFIPTSLIWATRGMALRALDSPIWQFHLPFYSHCSGKNFYTMPLKNRPSDDDGRLPLPPRELWEGYGKRTEVFLETGRKHVETMRSILSAAGFEWHSGSRVLDYGCATGRMMRWLADRADHCEIWGTDIVSDYVTWCNQELSPPFHFLLSTSHPHLPFEDRYFDLVYAGSVFTHIDDLAISWLHELRRITKVGGMLYLTIQNKHSIETLFNTMPDNWLTKRIRSHKECSKLIKSDFGVLALGRSVRAQVFYDTNYFIDMSSPFLEPLSVNDDAYGNQTAVLFKRVS